MKKVVTLVISILLITSGILIGLKYAGDILKGTGALQVNTNIKSKVYLDDKYIGDTPLCKCNGEDKLKTGNYSLKIVPEDKNISSFTQRIDINKDVLTFTERTFLPGGFASAYVLTLEKQDLAEPEILVASIPEGSLVTMDNNPQGVTPLLIKKVSAAEHKIELSKDGYAKKTIIVKPPASYKLAADVTLGIKNENSENLPLSSLTPSSKTASVSAQADTKALIKINSTPVNFLRVRKDPSTTSTEIAQVKPGETYPLISEKEGWFQIKLTNGESGWVSSEYSEKTASQ